MKRIILIAAISIFITSCKDKKKAGEPVSTENKTEATATNGKDAALTTWLKGKILTADDPAKDYHNFKLHADGMCEDKGGAKVSWIIEGEKLNVGGMMKLSIEKKDDNTLIMHRSLSDETYKVAAIQ
jgi:hypothetical protein